MLKSTAVFASVFFCSCGAVRSLEAAVPVEEYVPQVIIEGKWGTGPGEFGRINQASAEKHGIMSYGPISLDVNSRGEIYILDFVNNRIQKFSSSGKFMRGIPVYSLASAKGESVAKITGKTGFDVHEKPYYTGINMMIDSADNLYYYCVKGEGGEIWFFENDELKEKTAAEKGESGLWWQDGALYVSGSPKAEPVKKVQIRRDDENLTAYPAEKKSESGYLVSDISRKRELNFTIDKGGRLLRKGKIYFDEGKAQWKVPVGLGRKPWWYIYDAGGGLIAIKEMPPTDFRDEGGNCYRMEATGHVVRVKKFIRQEKGSIK